MAFSHFPAPNATPAIVRVVTHDQLATLLGGMTEATEISLTWTGGESARRKKDHGRVVKVCRYKGTINKARGINQPVWREREGQTPILRHVKAGTRYVELSPVHGWTQYHLEGAPCTRDEVADIVKPARLPSHEEYRTPRLDSITGAVVDGTHYAVMPNPPEELVDPSGGYEFDPNDTPDDSEMDSAHGW